MRNGNCNSPNAAALFEAATSRAARCADAAANDAVPLLVFGWDFRGGVDGGQDESGRALTERHGDIV
jgi:hypothetical protein